MDDRRDEPLEATTPQPGSPESGVGFLPVRWFQVFFTPARLFERLVDQPAWFGPLALGAVLTVIAALLIPPEIYEAQMREQFLARGQPVPEGFGAFGSAYRFAIAGFGTLGYALFTFIAAGLVALIFIFILGDRGRFKQYLSITTHAFLISATAALVLVPLRTTTGDPQANLSIGTFLVFLGDGWLGNFFRFMDLFSIWSYLLIAQGATQIDPKRSYTSAAVAALIIPALFAAVFAIFA